jgi:hypothetical protein
VESPLAQADHTKSTAELVARVLQLFKHTRTQVDHVETKDSVRLTVPALVHASGPRIAPQVQRGLRASGVGVVVLVARTNCIQELRPLVAPIVAALVGLGPGDLITVGKWRTRAAALRS